MAQYYRIVTPPSLGDLGIDSGMSTPAVIAAVAYIIVALTIILPFKIPVTNDQGDTVILPYNITQRLLILLILTIPTFLSVYSLNCMMVGQCVIWSNIVAALTVLWAIMFVALAYMYSIA